MLERWVVGWVRIEFGTMIITGFDRGVGKSFVADIMVSLPGWTSQVYWGECACVRVVSSPGVLEVFTVSDEKGPRFHGAL